MFICICHLSIHFIVNFFPRKENLHLDVPKFLIVYLSYTTYARLMLIHILYTHLYACTQNILVLYKCV